MFAPGVADRRNGAGRTHLADVTVSIRVMSAGTGYRYLLKSVAAGDGTRQLTDSLTRYYAEKGTAATRSPRSSARSPQMTGAPPLALRLELRFHDLERSEETGVCLIRYPFYVCRVAQLDHCLRVDGLNGSCRRARAPTNDNVAGQQ